MAIRVRWMSTVALAVLALALVPLAARAPRMTLLNAAVRVDFGWIVVAAAAAMGVLFAAAASLAPRRAACLALSGIALAAAVFGVARLRYRLEVRPDALFARELTGSTTVAWSDVARVERGTQALVVWGRGEEQIRVDTGAFEGHQKAALERALSRRIVESTAPITRAVPGAPTPADAAAPAVSSR
jgi:hypothetical protein